METKVTKQQEETIFRSKLPDIYIPKHLPLHSYIFENISNHSSRPCLINGVTGDVYTYAEVELTARRVASGLNKLGVKQGEVIMLLLHNSPQFVLSFLGASYRGAIATAANPFFTPAEIAKQAKASNSKLIITQAAYADKVKDLASDHGIKILCIDSAPDGCLHFSGLSEANEIDMPDVDISPEDVVALPYSSGTTGLPKGVIEDVILCVLPMFHIYALNSIMLCGLRVGAAILIMPKFDIGALLQLIQKYKITIAPIVPPIVCPSLSPRIPISMIVVDKDAQVRSSTLGKELEDSVRAKFPQATLGQGYGMTEAGPVLAMCLAFAKPFDKTRGLRDCGQEC
ncbi:hypothetical protein GH714_032876 [Hevea brasiliensis]|uniref:4-coumarate--CoA ligase n=1 Tax=Hevea brasiliensis TaxID=3981 RepID=A0A6A6NBN6_HEVBR|nr:hypothetical protein GH714_032876 [Hevea brasiliensis]